MIFPAFPVDRPFGPRPRSRATRRTADQPLHSQNAHPLFFRTLHSSSLIPVRAGRWLTAALWLSLAATRFLAAEPALMFTRGAVFALSPEDGKRIPIPLESTEVLLDVKPGLMEAQVTQTFVNRTDTALEATYFYPL